MRIALWAIAVHARHLRAPEAAAEDPHHVLASHILEGTMLAYYPAGCQLLDPGRPPEHLTEYEGSRAMSPDTCFSFCRESKPEAHLGRYFGIKGGRTCWCAAVYYGKEAKAGACDVECDGGGTGCGGYEATDVYHIHKWHKDAGEAPAGAAEATENAQDVRLAEKAEEEDTEDPQMETEHFFMWADGRSCGKSPMKVEGKETMVGHPKTCRVACVATPNCMGFTYDDSLNSCIFTSDVEADGIEQSDMLHCLIKNV